jgi:hydroxymethylpyrimidine/phosphomethylpyrimidine kinase
MRRALTIAGSDSGGGAGIQADLKTFERYGVFGTSALTLITAQNTLGVTALQMLPAELVEAQVRAVVSDLGADVIKTGALGTAEMVHTVVGLVDNELAGRALVVDPVIVSRRGHVLVTPETIDAMRTLLMTRASIVTPNLHEAAALTDLSVASLEDMRRAADQLLQLGARAALVKGGALNDPDVAEDVLATADGQVVLTRPRLGRAHTHGTGCSLAAAIAAGLARGLELEAAVTLAKDWVHAAIAAAPGLGQGNGPLSHRAGVLPWD